MIGPSKTHTLVCAILALMSGCTEITSYNVHGSCPVEDWGTIFIDGHLKGRQSPASIDDVYNYVDTELCIRRLYVFNVDGKPDSWNQLEVELAIPPEKSSFSLFLTGFKARGLGWRSPSHELFMTFTISEERGTFYYLGTGQQLVLEEDVIYYEVTAHPKD